MWIPDALYERLPWVYGAAGVGTFLAFDVTGPGALSPPLLIAAAAIVAMRRHTHRAARMRRRTRRR